VQRSKNPRIKKIKPEGKNIIKISDKDVNFFLGVRKVIDSLANLKR
jgi:hypothetical protein